MSVKVHIDALYDAINQLPLEKYKTSYNVMQLYGILYAIGSDWEHYKELFE